MIWFITGCSTGFGRALATHLLDAGHRVAVTARNVADVEDLVAAHPHAAKAFRLDVTDADQVAEAVAGAEAHFGQIDVLVNNAGIGYFGSVEESEDDEVRRMFEINFWGLVHVTQAVLPGMRARRFGRIVNISSIAGLRGFPTAGFYNATKHAVNGLSEALALEVKPLGIAVTVVMPSGFRTDWAGRSANEAAHTIDDYADTAHRNAANLRRVSGHQPGDPMRAAKAIADAAQSDDPPLHLLLGNDALNGARRQLALLTADFDANEEVSRWVDAPEG